MLRKILGHLVVVLASSACWGQGLEPGAAPEERVVLGAVPRIELPATQPPGEEESRRIRSLIDDLTRLDAPDYGLSSTLAGSAFAPLPQLQSFQAGLIQINHRLTTNGALLELVKLGPRAMPFLLEALSDPRPTKLELEHESGFGGMWFAAEMAWNPASPIERDAMRGREPGPGGAPGEHVPRYTVRIGDVCFAIIGQITGRGYSAVRYQPSACVVLNSPVQDPQLAQRVRQIWSSPDPHRRLLDALLSDFATRGVHAGDSLDHWALGASFQVPAVTRLLYYYPELAAPLVAARLDGLEVGDTGPDMEAYLRQCVVNGVRAPDLIDAAAWSDRAEIRAALGRIMARTDDPDVFLHCLPAADPSAKAAAAERLLEYLMRPEPPGSGPFGTRYKVLIALAGVDPERARGEFQRLAAGSLRERRMVCHGVRSAASSWGADVLLPLLGDQRPIEGWSYAVDPEDQSRRLPIRVCDEAAESIVRLRPDVEFRMQGTHEDLDVKIKQMETALQGGGSGR